MRLGDLDGGLEDIDRAIGLLPTDGIIYLRRTSLFAEAERWEDALEDCTRAADLAPDDAEVAYSRGVVYWELGRYEEAVAEYSRAIELDAENVTTWHARGAALIRLGRWDEAIADLTHVLWAEPTNAVALLRRAMAYELAGQDDVAAVEYDRATALNGKPAEYARLWKHLLLRQSGQEKAAAAILASHASAETNDAWIGRLFELFMEKLSAEDLLAAAAK